MFFGSQSGQDSVLKSNYKGTLFFFLKKGREWQQSTRILPFFGLQPGRRISGDEKQGSHGMHVTESWGEERACQLCTQLIWSPFPGPTRDITRSARCLSDMLHVKQPAHLVMQLRTYPEPPTGAQQNTRTGATRRLDHFKHTGKRSSKINADSKSERS